jgi:hypothetical protein
LDENGEIICPQSGICVDNELPPECQSDFDCLNGQICFFLDYSNVGTCIQEEAVCNVDTDCLTGQACIDGLCQERACLPVVCDLYCENGFQIDANGCEMCVCNEPPMECLDDSQCFNGYHCELMDCYDSTGLDCNGGGICVKDADPNQCGSDISCAMGEVCVNGECVPEPSCDCYEIYSPVCGTDNITYGNDCEANCANVEIAYSGVCR